MRNVIAEDGGLKIFGNFFSEKGILEVEEALVNTDHEERAIRKNCRSFL